MNIHAHTPLSIVEVAIQRLQWLHAAPCMLVIRRSNQSDFNPAPQPRPAAAPPHTGRSHPHTQAPTHTAAAAAAGLDMCMFETGAAPVPTPQLHSTPFVSAPPHTQADPPLSIVEVAIQRLRQLLLSDPRTEPAIKGAVRAEWWAHTRPPGAEAAGHQLHFDVDERRLRQVSRRGTGDGEVGQTALSG